MPELGIVGVLVMAYIFYRLEKDEEMEQQPPPPLKHEYDGWDDDDY